MIKTHSFTGYKYLCKTTRKDWQNYTGSGIKWKRHLHKHGKLFVTTLLFETVDANEFKRVALETSIKLNVVNDPSWANMCHEEGAGGGTSLDRKWITIGNEDRLIDKTKDIPDGWKAGRSKCVFNDSNKQREFGANVNPLKRGATMVIAWENRSENKLGSRVTGLFGDANPTKRIDVRAKMSASAKINQSWTCHVCGINLKRRGLHGVKTSCLP